MSVPTFNPPLTPSAGSADKPEIKILEAQFGDGYTQTAADGLNNIRRVVSLKWEVLTIAQASQILAFMNAQQGSEPFYYMIPGEPAAIIWTCKEFGQGFSAYNYRSVTATLRQSFNLVS